MHKSKKKPIKLVNPLSSMNHILQLKHNNFVVREDVKSLDIVRVYMYSLTEFYVDVDYMNP